MQTGGSGPLAPKTCLLYIAYMCPCTIVKLDQYILYIYMSLYNCKAGPIKTYDENYYLSYISPTYVK